MLTRAHQVHFDLESWVPVPGTFNQSFCTVAATSDIGTPLFWVLKYINTNRVHISTDEKCYYVCCFQHEECEVLKNA